MADEATVHEITRRESRGSAALWFGVLGGPLVWMLQLVVNYSLEEWFACSPGSGANGHVLGITVRTFALGVTAILGVIALAAAVTAVRCYLRLRPGRETDDVSTRARWLSLAGVFNGILYLVIILPSLAPPLLLHVCESSP
ncbi:MAG TPA: hypothetical protein VFK89_02905 [Actinomycetota bacterium]|nr:hypothetical protein [Actinomycetota bacterium]